MTLSEFCLNDYAYKWNLAKNYSPIPIPNSFSFWFFMLFCLTGRWNAVRFILFGLPGVKSKGMCIRKVIGQRLNHLKYVIRVTWALAVLQHTHIHLQHKEAGNGPAQSGRQVMKAWQITSLEYLLYSRHIIFVNIILFPPAKNSVHFTGEDIEAQRDKLSKAN